MADINIDISYPEHLKTKRTIGLLGRGSDVLPIRLWLYCGRQHPEDGRLIGYSVQEIESVCDWWGEKGRMVEVFLTVGWLEQIENGFQVHDWNSHQGHLESYRKRAKMAADARWSKLKQPQPMLQALPQAMLSPPSSNASHSIVPLSTASASEGGGAGGREKELSPLGKRIAGWFGRRDSTAWSEKELRQLKVIEAMRTPEEDVALLEKRYVAKEPYIRRDILTLLNNWPGEIDRAKAGPVNGVKKIQYGEQF